MNHSRMSRLRRAERYDGYPSRNRNDTRIQGPPAITFGTRFFGRLHRCIALRAGLHPDVFDPFLDSLLHHTLGDGRRSDDGNAVDRAGNR